MWVVDICTSWSRRLHNACWLSGLLQSELKMKLLEVPQCPIAGDATDVLVFVLWWAASSLFVSVVVSGHCHSCALYIGRPMKLLTHTAAPSPLGLSCCFSRSFSYSECCCCFFTIILFTSFVARYVAAKVPEVPDPILQPDPCHSKHQWSSSCTYSRLCQLPLN